MYINSSEKFKSASHYPIFTFEYCIFQLWDSIIENAYNSHCNKIDILQPSRLSLGSYVSQSEIYMNSSLAAL